MAVTGGIMDSSIERASLAPDTDDAEEIREPNNHELSEAGVLDVGYQSDQRLIWTCNIKIVSATFWMHSS